MEINEHDQTGPNQESEKLKKDAKQPLNPSSFPPAAIYQDTKTDLNAKILKITMMIKDQFPELSKYLEEMPITVPNVQHPQVELENLKKYFHSLTAILDRYKLEHINRK